MADGALAIDFRLGDHNEVLADETCDLLLVDGPYGKRTHEKQRHGRKEPKYTRKGNAVLAHRGLSYRHWEPEDVDRFVCSWHERTRGWMCCFASHDLIPAYEEAFKRVGRYYYTPVSCVQLGMNVRLAGDGPSNWTTYLLRAKHRNPLCDHLMVARPKAGELWGTLPGAYVGRPFDAGENMLDRSKRPTAGAKPVWLMRDLVLAYSRPGQRVIDPCAGRGTTLIAAALEGRAALGAEIDPATYDAGKLFLAGGFKASAEQVQLF